MIPESSDLFTGRVRTDGTRSLFLIAGPCVLEDEGLNLLVAEQVKKIATETDIPAIFKASFDKANRSSIESYRGPGLEEGLRWLSDVKAKFEVPIITDVHDSTQTEAAAEVADILQLPAFLSRQTDLIVAIAKTGKAVNIKKAQFLSPLEMGHIVKKFESAGNDQLMPVSYTHLTLPTSDLV